MNKTVSEQRPTNKAITANEARSMAESATNRNLNRDVVYDAIRLVALCGGSHCTVQVIDLVKHIPKAIFSNVGEKLIARLMTELRDNDGFKVRREKGSDQREQTDWDYLVIEW